MPQLYFILSEKERTDFIRFSFKNGFQIIPDKHYTHNIYDTVDNMDAYHEKCDGQPLLFLIIDDYTLYNLEMDSFENNNGKQYFIRQRYGGPTIDFFSPILGERENKIVGPGFIGTYPFYYCGNKKFIPNKALITKYKLLTSYIKSMSRKIELTNRSFWVGDYTIKKAKNYEIKLLPISDIDLLELV